VNKRGRSDNTGKPADMGTIDNTGNRDSMGTRSDYCSDFDNTSMMENMGSIPDTSALLSQRISQPAELQSHYRARLL